TVAREHRHAGFKKRLYLHLDLNCFYAQVEQRARNLYGFPVAMGGWRKPDGTPRGIVATASYEARKLGVKTAMSAYEAWQICPYLVFLQIDYDKYQGISRRLRSILEDSAPDVETYSMDEYFLDITHLLGKGRKGIEGFASQLKNRIYDRLGLVCSVGVATSKTYSKLASDLQKPNGLKILLTPDDAAEYLFRLPLDEVWGIGSRRYEKLRKNGLYTIADAFHRGPGIFKKLFGEMQGQLFHDTVTGRDQAKILDNDHHIPDEISYMHTFSDWTVNIDQIRGEVVRAVRNVCYRLRGYNRKARKWCCYIRYQDAGRKGENVLFSTEGYTNLDDYILQSCLARVTRCIRNALHRGYRIRGIGLNSIEMVHYNQYELFFREKHEIRQLYRASDLINNVYGIGTVEKAASKNGVPGKTHFTGRS
ncbi:MAG: DNA polymerase IV, partial [Balneolaceae bacterium]